MSHMQLAAHNIELFIINFICAGHLERKTIGMKQHSNAIISMLLRHTIFMEKWS